MDRSSVNMIIIVSGASAMGDKAFSPNAMNVRAGDIVTWKNTDIETHTVTCGPSEDSPGFDSRSFRSWAEFRTQVRKDRTISLHLYDPSFYERQGNRDLIRSLCDHRYYYADLERRLDEKQLDDTGSLLFLFS